MLMNFSLIRESAKTPTRANKTDAGMDVYFAPDNGSPMHILPKQSRLLETGLKFDIPEGHYLEVKNRSSIASKRMLIVGACVVDSGYQGEVFVNFHNIGHETQTINPGDKIAQIVMLPCSYPSLQEVPEGLLFGGDQSGRGAAGFGSTGF